VVIPLAVQLSIEVDFNQLLERILEGARRLCRADGGSIYLRTDDNRLAFMIMRTDSLGVAMGGTNGMAIPYPSLHLYDPSTGAPNQRHVATHTVLTGTTVNVADVYQPTPEFDFSGTREFDRLTGYHTTSLLSLPLWYGPKRIIGVIQIVNAQNPDTDRVVPFDPALQPVAEALASLAAVALEAYERERGLRRQIEHLRIEIDDVRRAATVAEITGSERFHELQARARAQRQRRLPTGDREAGSADWSESHGHSKDA
jgi:GAF domain-containing protein